MEFFYNQIISYIYNTHCLAGDAKMAAELCLSPKHPVVGVFSSGHHFNIDRFPNGQLSIYKSSIGKPGG